MNNKNINTPRPESRMNSRRSALGNITEGIDQSDMLILTFDNELRVDNLNKVRKSIIKKDYDNAIDDIIKLNKKIKTDDEEQLYSLVLDDLNNEFMDLLKPRDSNKTIGEINKKINSNDRKVKAPSKCIPILAKRKSQDFISFTSSSPA
jgi:hypothetical protein